MNAFDPHIVPQPLILMPFPDGTCLKMVKRELPNSDQHILVNVAGDQLAITKNAAMAHLICDSVNMLFAAQAQHDRESAAFVNTIATQANAPTKDLPATQD